MLGGFMVGWYVIFFPNGTFFLLKCFEGKTKLQKFPNVGIANIADLLRGWSLVWHCFPNMPSASSERFSGNNMAHFKKYINLYFTLLSLLFLSHPCVSSSVLSDLLQPLAGIRAINGMQAIYEPFEVIYIQAFMVSYVGLFLAVLSLAWETSKRELHHFGNMQGPLMKDFQGKGIILLRSIWVLGESAAWL